MSEADLKLLVVEILATDLMRKHKVDYLSFKFNNDKSALGICTDDYIAIQKKHALFDNIEDIRNTILHEIAHALAGLENNHNAFWKDIAKDIGVIFDSHKYKRY